MNQREGDGGNSDGGPVLTEKIIFLFYILHLALIFFILMMYNFLINCA